MGLFDTLFKPDLDKLFSNLKDGNMDVRESTVDKLIKHGGPEMKEKVLAELERIAKGDLTDVAATGTAKMAKLFIKAGVDVNIRTSQGGYTPLIIAAARGKTEIVKVLLDAGADIYLTGKDGISAESKAYNNSRKTDLNKHYIETYKLLAKTRGKIESSGTQ